MSQKNSKVSLQDGLSNSNVSSSSPVVKKLVQARLPFKSITSGTHSDVDSVRTFEKKKRKLSNTEDENRPSKLCKSNETIKENIVDVEVETIDLSSDTTASESESEASTIIETCENIENMNISTVLDRSSAEIEMKSDSETSNSKENFVENIVDDVDTSLDVCKTPNERKNRERNKSTERTSEQSSLTPKQLQRKLESEKKMLAKQKAKEERERRQQEEKEQRQRERDEKEKQKRKEREDKEEQKRKEREDKEEQKRKEREDREEQKRKEKEERDKKKQAEIDAKNEEKRQKDEEKRLKEEERMAKEEAELKKKRKEAEAFTKFFAKKSNRSVESDKLQIDDSEIQLNFMPFQIKDDMRLAPVVRRKLSPARKSTFEDVVLNGKFADENSLYVRSLRNGTHLAEKQGKTWPTWDSNDDLMIIDDLEGATAIEESSTNRKFRAKFFKFDENRRPPYYGTWQKKSSTITARRPFASDIKFFDYEIDSDDEWEEDNEPGESLHGSDDEKDKESDDDYDIDNEFFVPHGHLSDEEIGNEDELEEDNSPDAQKAKLKIMQKTFSDEMKKKTEKIKPRLIGLIWQKRDGSQSESCPDSIWRILQIRAMIFTGTTIQIPKEPIDKCDENDDNNDAKKSSAMKKRIKITEDNVADLIRLIHGNTKNSGFLMKEFHAFMANKNKDNEHFKEFSLASIRLKIKELAEWKPCPEEGPLFNRYCWYVAPDKRKLYNLEDLSILNDWSYILTPKSKTNLKIKEFDKGTDVNEEQSPSGKAIKSKLGNIQKFTKVLSDDEKKKKFSASIPDGSDVLTNKSITESNVSSSTQKKRVKLLMSGPLGQEIPVQAKNSLISQYLSNSNLKKKLTEPQIVNVEPICID